MQKTKQMLVKHLLQAVISVWTMLAEVCHHAITINWYSNSTMWGIFLFDYLPFLLATLIFNIKTCINTHANIPNKLQTSNTYFLWQSPCVLDIPDDGSLSAVPACRFPASDVAPAVATSATTFEKHSASQWNIEMEMRVRKPAGGWFNNRGLLSQLGTCHLIFSPSALFTCKSTCCRFVCLSGSQCVCVCVCVS